MMFPIWLDRLPTMIAKLIASRFRWSPIGKAISIHIEDSGDPYLPGRTVDGVIQAYARAVDCPRRELLLVVLREPLHYGGHFTSDAIDVVVLTPALEEHPPARLLVSWVAVRIVDARSFRDESYGRSIGIGRMIVGRSNANPSSLAKPRRSFC